VPELHLHVSDQQLAALRAAAEREGAASPEELAAFIVAERLAEYGVDAGHDAWDIDAMAPEQLARLDALIVEGLESGEPRDLTPEVLDGVFAEAVRRSRQPT
jgi:hypothetical protein